MPESLKMNSVLDSGTAAILPSAMAAACAALWRRAYSLEEAAGSSLEMLASGVKRPVPLRAIFVTGVSSVAGRLSEAPAKGKAAGNGAAKRLARWPATPLNTAHEKEEYGPRSVFRRTGFDRLPRLGAGPLRHGGNGGFRLRPAPCGRARSAPACSCGDPRALSAMAKETRR